ncbi:MAG TPA: T9SS type A sorting domain-containing protein, partial [Chitinophagales bacterium]|nr:T9SS type A sorting domain-containing protein [Chitinophagales bacterium]
SMVQALVSTTSGAGGTVGVSEILASDYPALKVYPNPAREEVHFELAGALQEEQHEVILFDYTGKAVQHFIISGNRTYTLKTNALSSGIYFYRVLKQGLPVQHGKLVITQ